MRQNYNTTQFQIHWQLPVIVLVGLAVGALFFWWAPSWALWTIASMLGGGVSIALGAGYKRAVDRKKKSDEIRHMAELQNAIDNSLAIADPVLRERLGENFAYTTADKVLHVPITEKTPLDLQVLDGLNVEQINSVRHPGENHE